MTQTKINGVPLIDGTATTLPFSDEAPVLAITNDLLQRTFCWADVEDSLPPSRPVEHYQFISSLMDNISIHGYEPKLENIYIKNAHVKKRMWKNKEVECPPENYFIERLVGKINIIRNEEANKEFGSSLAFSFSERGIELAWGLNVWNCTNFNIFGARRVATYGNNKMTYYNMLELVEKWAIESPDIFDKNERIAMRLKEAPCSNGDANIMFGDLLQSAVRQNLNSKNKAPLNITQLSATVRNFQKNSGNATEFTGWDFVNAGTQALHIYRNDFMSVLESTEAFNSFVVDKYGLN